MVCGQTLIEKGIAMEKVEYSGGWLYLLDYIIIGDLGIVLGENDEILMTGNPTEIANLVSWYNSSVEQDI